MTENSEPPFASDPGAGTEAVVGDNPRPRRGWQLPTGQVAAGVGAPSTGPIDGANPSGESHRELVVSLRGGVIGQVTDVNQNASSHVTIRLERYDPHAGRTSVLIVRLRGEDAMGFAETGDWVEATGKKKSAYIDASRCINHTTGAVYSNVGNRVVGLVFAVVFFGVFLLVVSFIIIGIVTNH